MRQNKRRELIQKSFYFLFVNAGIAGFVARTGEVVLTRDAYTHPHFDSQYDTILNYTTKSVLCVPILDVHSERVVAVVQVPTYKANL